MINPKEAPSGHQPGRSLKTKHNRPAQAPVHRLVGRIVYSLIIFIGFISFAVLMRLLGLNGWWPFLLGALFFPTVRHLWRNLYPPNEPCWADVLSVPLNVPVLLSYENGYMFVDIARLIHNGEVSFQHEGCDPAIKYWMPLPDQPKAEITGPGEKP